MFCSLIKLQLHVLMATSGFPIFSLCRKKSWLQQNIFDGSRQLHAQTWSHSFFSALLRRREFDSPCCTPETFLHIVRLSSHTACYDDCEAVHQKQPTRPHSSFKLDKIEAYLQKIKIMVQNGLEFVNLGSRAFKLSVLVIGSLPNMVLLVNITFLVGPFFNKHWRVLTKTMDVPFILFTSQTL